MPQLVLANYMSSQPGATVSPNYPGDQLGSHIKTLGDITLRTSRVFEKIAGRAKFASGRSVRKTYFGSQNVITRPHGEFKRLTYRNIEDRFVAEWKPSKHRIDGGAMDATIDAANSGEGMVRKSWTGYVQRKMLEARDQVKYWVMNGTSADDFGVSMSGLLDFLPSTLSGYSWAGVSGTTYPNFRPYLGDADADGYNNTARLDIREVMLLQIAQQKRAVPGMDLESCTPDMLVVSRATAARIQNLCETFVFNDTMNVARTGYKLAGMEVMGDDFFTDDTIALLINTRDIEFITGMNGADSEGEGGAMLKVDQVDLGSAGEYEKGTIGCNIWFDCGLKIENPKLHGRINNVNLTS